MIKIGLLMEKVNSISLFLKMLRTLIISCSDLFEGCQAVSDLTLSANQLEAVPASALEALKASLSTLDLGENLIADLPHGWLQGFGRLYGLRLAENKSGH